MNNGNNTHNMYDSKMQILENLFYFLYDEYGIQNEICNFCTSNIKTSKFDSDNNLTEHEAIYNDIDPYINNLKFNCRICKICRDKKKLSVYPTM